MRIVVYMPPYHTTLPTMVYTPPTHPVHPTIFPGTPSIHPGFMCT